MRDRHASVDAQQGCRRPTQGSMRRLLLTGAMLRVLLLPEAASAVSAARTSVAYSYFRSPVQRGHQAKVTPHTKADLRCSIKVTYQGGQYRPASLASRRASSTGNVSWAWIVPAKAIAYTSIESGSCDGADPATSVESGFVTASRKRDGTVKVNLHLRDVVPNTAYFTRSAC